MEHQEHADRLEREAERLEHESERVGGRIEETQRDWEQKAQDQQIPGAQSEEDRLALDPEDEDKDEDEEDS